MQLMLDVPAGFILDKYGYKKILKLSTGIFVVAALILFFGLNTSTIVLTLILAMLGWLSFGPGTDAYILSAADERQAGRYFSTRDIFDAGGVVLALMVLPLIANGSTSTIALIIAGLLVLALIFLFFVRKEKRGILPKIHPFYVRRHFIHKIIKGIKRLNPASGMLLLVGTTASTFYGIVWFVVPIMIARLGGDKILSFGLAMFDIAVVTVGFALGRLADKYSKKKLIFLGLLVFSIAGTLLGVNFGIWFLIMGFIASTGHEMTNISLWAWLDHLDKNHKQDALITGAIAFFEDLGWTLGPMLGGLLFVLIGPSLTIAAGGLLLFLTWGITSFVLSSPKVTFAENAPRLSFVPFRRKHKS
jgi:LPXTG-motif cell wall-anchored protein